MKRKRLLAKLSAFLRADEATQKQEIDATREILKLLKKKENALKEKLEKHPERHDAERIATQLQVIYKQRKRGVDRLRELRE